MRSKNIFKSQDGFSIIEVVASILMVALITFGVMKSAFLSYRVGNQTKIDAIANQLAVSKLEEFARVDPIGISEDSGGTETGVLREGISFDRTVTVTINADFSRTISVAVQSEASLVPIEQEVSSTFYPWGSR